MSVLRYWHPVLRSADLPSDRAAGVTVDGKSIALFRAGAGKFGAVEDNCAHRRMKLSLGRTRDGELVCPYHGWTYNPAGEGESPSSPKLHACVASYDCAESRGAIWIKERSGTQDLPQLLLPDWDFVGVVTNTIRAPLELVIDNFSELEHTVTTHPDFGFDPGQAAQAEVVFETTEATITVRSHGPAKMPPLDTRLGAGIRPGDRFRADYTFRFDPPCSAVTHWWTHSTTGRERMAKYHVIHYFLPQDAGVTTMFTFIFLKIRWPLLGWLGPHLGWFLRRKTHQTVMDDTFLLENLAEKSPSLQGMQFSRFDPVLAMTRERLRRIYYGTSAVVS